MACVIYNNKESLYNMSHNKGGLVRLSHKSLGDPKSQRTPNLPKLLIIQIFFPLNMSILPPVIFKKIKSYYGEIKLYLGGGVEYFLDQFSPHQEKYSHVLDLSSHIYAKSSCFKEKSSHIQDKSRNIYYKYTHIYGLIQLQFRQIQSYLSNIQQYLG